eukprot:m.23841 g.23841  ORF g.23841 m.23841 type:complete len:374 (+) comp9033_c0_seq1:20-1141(+)
MTSCFFGVVVVFVFAATTVGVVSVISATEPEEHLIDFGNGTVRTLSHVEWKHIIENGEGGRYMEITKYPSPQMMKDGSNLLRSYPSKPAHKGEVDAILSELDGQDIINRIANLSDFNNRYYQAESGADAVNWLMRQYKDVAQGRSDVTVELFVHDWVQPSIIVTIEGDVNADEYDEIVILGGHIDSIALGGSPLTARAPGADDDGSGSATVFEVFRSLIKAAYKPTRTVQFHAYSAEEVGLLGSQDIANAYANQKKDVYSMMQFDMTGYPKSDAKIGLIRDHVSANLSDCVAMLIDEYTVIGYENSKCGYACSDHASWNRNGYPSSFPFEVGFGGDNPYIHTSKDTVDRVSLERVEQFARLGVAYVVELAGSV